MKKWLAKTTTEKIFKLDLQKEVTLDNNTPYTIKIEDKVDEDTFLVKITNSNPYINGVEKGKIELKGKIDVEYLHYRGTVSLMKALGKKDMLTLHVLNLEKVNSRGATRVPYCHSITMCSPKMEPCYLMNISTTGALIYLPEQLKDSVIEFKIKLGRHTVTLKANVLEQTKAKDKIYYHTRCQFVNVDKKTEKIIHKLVVNVKKSAKIRLQRL